MEFIFFGAGAIGTYIGGSLALSGNRVVFVEQPGPAEILRKDGLRLKIGPQTYHLPKVEVFISLAEALEERRNSRAVSDQVIVFALKSFDTPAVVDTLIPLSGSLPPALCLQNGVENEAVLERAFGPGRVIAGTVTSAVGRNGVGDITLERKRGVGIAGGHRLSGPIFEAFRRAGLNARFYPDGIAMKWSKLLTNLVANATAAILDLTPREIFSDPRLFALEREMLRECLRVMRARRIPVVDLPGTPVRLLAFAAERLPGAISQPVLIRAVGGGRGGKMPSFHIDLHAGRGMTEVRWLNGAVARAGETADIAAPVNRALTEILEGLAEGRLQKDDYHHHPEQLLLRIPQYYRS